MMPLFNMEIPANLMEVSNLRKSARKRLQELRLPIEVINDVQLVISEYANNLIIHSEKKPTKIRLDISISGLLLAIEIIDDASPFENYRETFAKGALKFQQIDKTSGRGIGILSKILINPTYEAGEKNSFCGWLNISPHRPRLLLVEDDDNLREFYSHLLSQSFTLHLAVSVEEAMSIIRTEMLDIIVADLHLTGGGTALELLQNMENSTEMAIIPTIIYTGDIDENMHRKALELGADTILIKPVSANLLKNSVDMTLARSTKQRASLFRYFAKSVNNLIKKNVPKDNERFQYAISEGSAEIGGGDLVISYEYPEFTRIIFADIMGHGISATAASVAFSSAVRTVQSIIYKNNKPSDFLNIFSRTMRQDEALSDIMATMVVIDLPHKEGIMRYALAGHPPPILLNKKGIHTIRRGGPMPALLPEDIYETYEEKLHKGDRLLLYTDGIDPQGLASSGKIPKWFTKNLKEHREYYLSEANYALSEEIVTNIGVAPIDDWTVLMVEVRE